MLERRKTTGFGASDLPLANQDRGSLHVKDALQIDDYEERQVSTHCQGRDKLYVSKVQKTFMARGGIAAENAHPCRPCKGGVNYYILRA